jgi:2-polyprenyl-6-methoxyphenol hydroxylase-like FAD-dependent oxidoreductase
MTQRSVEIAGAGFAGLVAAAALAECGYRVRVHEHTPFLRAEGFALTIHPNGVKVLKRLGVFEEATRGAMRIARLETRNARNEVTLEITPADTLFRVSRQQLIEALANEAERRGVEILTDSQAVGAEAAGVLVLADGRRLRADLVIGADGVHSAVRDSLRLRYRQRPLPAGGAFRLLIPRSAEERRQEPGETAVNREYWSGTRRVIANPCSREELYLALSCVATDASGRRLPLDVDSWTQRFPHLGDLMERILRNGDWSRVRWAPFVRTHLHRWSDGRVVILGDAAHAMPPDLGQGGGTAMMNALALGHALDAEPDLERGLARWEARERSITEHTQRWATWYNHTTLWPERLRTWTFKRVGASPYLRGQVQRTARHTPSGC